MKTPEKGNPIITKQGACDPHVHVFNDRVYLYASHDNPDGPDFLNMPNWQIWSSSDLVNWEKESMVYPEDTPIGPSNACWAVDAAEKNGTYYLYVSHGMKETYVLESNDPGKGFTEKLGKPILPEGLTKTLSYDPTVFTDDDGSSYILFGTPVWAGGDSYYIAKLNEDMVSLAETPRKIELDDPADDKSFLHKHNGIYYLTWASFYATSDNVYGPYKTQGNFGLSGDHGSFFEWHEQWYMAFTVDETIQNSCRASGLAYIHYRENGEMCADMLIREYGVGKYNANWDIIEAEWFTKGYQIKKTESVWGHFEVHMKNGSWVEYPNIYNLPDNPWLRIHCYSDEEVAIDVYEGDTLLTTLNKSKPVPNGSQFYNYSLLKAQLPLSAGTHSLKLIARGDVCLNTIQFIA